MVQAWQVTALYAVGIIAYAISMHRYLAQCRARNAPALGEMDDLFARHHKAVDWYVIGWGAVIWPVSLATIAIVRILDRRDDQR